MREVGWGCVCLRGLGPRMMEKERLMKRKVGMSENDIGGKVGLGLAWQREEMVNG